MSTSSRSSAPSSRPHPARTATAVPLLVHDPARGGWQVHELGLQALSSIAEPVALVGIAGTYRFGKSTLLNALAGQVGCFSTSASDRGHTRGAWIFVTDRTVGAGARLVLMDTEGLSDAGAADPAAAREVFALSILLASVLIYNVDGAINEQHITALHAALASLPRALFDARGGIQGGAPRFVWAVRDSSLDLGGRSSAAEYLEEAMTPSVDLTAEASRGFAARACISAALPDARCLLFPKPGPVAALADVHRLELPALAPAFRSALTSLDELMRSARPRTVRSELPGADARPLSGQMLALLVGEVLQMLRSRAFRPLPSLWATVVQGACTAAVASARTEVAHWATRWRENMPLSPEVHVVEMVRELPDLRARVLEEVRAKARLGLPDEEARSVCDELDRWITAQVLVLDREDMAASQARCEQRIRALHTDLMAQVARGEVDTSEEALVLVRTDLEHGEADQSMGRAVEMLFNDSGEMVTRLREAMEGRLRLRALQQQVTDMETAAIVAAEHRDAELQELHAQVAAMTLQNAELTGALEASERSVVRLQRELQESQRLENTLRGRLDQVNEQLRQLEDEMRKR